MPIAVLRKYYDWLSLSGRLKTGNFSGDRDQWSGLLRCLERVPCGHMDNVSFNSHRQEDRDWLESEY